ncbi:MAG: FAD:protein FMN transferase [Desulfobacterales bacterium]|nr:FAD:protein FMN transferase [Desulfobacterales bacterium]
MEKSEYLPSQYRNINRRAFLRLSGFVGLGMAGAGIIPGVAEAVKFKRNLYKVSETKLAMGTFVSMTLIHPSRDEAQEAMGRAFEEIERLIGLMSRFDDSSAVAQLNKEGLQKDLPPEVINVVSTALDYYRISQGTFDISVKPVVDLFRTDSGKENMIFPRGNDLSQALKLVGSDKIQVSGRTIGFKVPGMGITLDGIAKGYIVDCASKVLTSLHVKNHLINAGGDIRAMGSKRDKKPWTVAIEDPCKRKQYPDIIHVTDGAVATSGNYEVYFDKEKMLHHIMDPKTGLSTRSSDSVSVSANTAMDADALSTTVSVMDPVAGIRFINSIPECECLVMADKAKVFKSKGWKSAAI